MLIKKYAYAIFIVSLIISGCNTTPAIVVKAGSGDQSVTAKSGKTFSIQLDAQLSTGYSWKLVDLPASLSIIKEIVLTPENESGKDKTGGFEIQEFVFKSMEKGDLTLTFKYGEHWKDKPQYVKTSTVKVRVE